MTMTMKTKNAEKRKSWKLKNWTCLGVIESELGGWGRMMGCLDAISLLKGN